MTDVFHKHLELLQEFESLPSPEISESIFDIAGYPHYENVASNILSFYLNPNNEHGLGNLLLSSLLNLSGGIESRQDVIQISREVSTKNGGRLDIVIETDNQIIGIENKIYHHLNNDLADYSDSIDEWAKPKQLGAIKIVLSTRKEVESSGFVCVTYENFLQKIRDRLGEYISTSSQKWLLYLIDFINTIEKLSGKKMDIDKNDIFFIENEDRIIELINDRNKFIAKLNGMVLELKEIIQQPSDCEKQWVYAKSVLVHDFNFSGHTIAFDLEVTPKGWVLKLFGRDANSKSYLSELFFSPPLIEHKNNLKVMDSRYVLQQFPINSELEEIKAKLLEWMNILIRSNQNHAQTHQNNRLL
jgi:hypothetical protein